MHKTPNILGHWLTSSSKSPFQKPSSRREGPTRLPERLSLPLLPRPGRSPRRSERLSSRGPINTSKSTYNRRRRRSDSSERRGRPVTFTSQLNQKSTLSSGSRVSLKSLPNQRRFYNFYDCSRSTTVSSSESPRLPNKCSNSSDHTSLTERSTSKLSENSSTRGVTPRLTDRGSQSPTTRSLRNNSANSVSSVWRTWFTRLLLAVQTSNRPLHPFGHSSFPTLTEDGGLESSLVTLRVVMPVTGRST